MATSITRNGLTLSLWDGREKGKNLRVYLNGLPGQMKGDAVWLECGAGDIYPPIARSYGDSNFVFAAEKWLQTQGNPTWGQVCAWMTQPTPIPAPVVPQNLRHALESALIVHLVPAARMAGLAFKNGLQKAEIIDRLLRNEELAKRAVAALETLRNGGTPDKKPAPDWLADEEPMQTGGAPAPALNTLPAVDLSAYARITYVDGQTAALRERAGSIEKAMLHQSAAIKALQDAAPIVLQFPEKPAPVKVDGLTHPQFADLVRDLRAGLHCMLVGGAGSGKTTASEQAAKALERKYYKHAPPQYVHEILGHFDAHNRYNRTATRDAVEHGGVVCYDEADRSAAEALIALNAVLDASEYVAFPDGLIRKHPDFVAVLCTNTDGSGATMQYASASRQDGSTMDRVMVYDWQIDPRIETQMSRGEAAWLAAVLAIREFVRTRGILDVVATARATKHGAISLQSGADRVKVLERTCKRGALVEAWPDVLRLPAVAAYLKG